jgi:hypothetical protein
MNIVIKYKIYLHLLLNTPGIWLHGTGVKAISWSLTVYSKNLSSQCKLTTQIEQVQNKAEKLLTWYLTRVKDYGV